MLSKKLKYPMIVKSLTYESSIGISQASVVANEEQLVKRVKYIHDTILTPAIVEQFIDGRELYVGVLGNHRLRVLPGVGNVVCEDARHQLAHRDRAREMERQVPEAARHRHGGSAIAQRHRAEDPASGASAPTGRSICPATRVSTSGWMPATRRM